MSGEAVVKFHCGYMYMYIFKPPMGSYIVAIISLELMSFVKYSISCMLLMSNTACHQNSNFFLFLPGCELPAPDEGYL